MRRFSLGVSLLLLVLFLVGCSQPTTSRVQIGQTQFEVTVADEPAEQALGLGDTPSLGNNQGMLFVFDESDTRTFWMKGVEYPIDIIWIQDKRVVGSVTAVPEPTNDESSYVRYVSPEPVDMVLEVPAGTVATEQIGVGDNVLLDE